MQIRLKMNMWSEGYGTKSAPKLQGNPMSGYRDIEVVLLGVHN